jgi:hypothetical protein
MSAVGGVEIRSVRWSTRPSMARVRETGRGTPRGMLNAGA